MSKPFFSVIMPVYNSEKYIESAVNSILNQTLTNFEFIIINDTSTDRTGELLKQINDKRVKVISNTNNLGNYPSRNIGIKVSSGEFICVMDSDDLALPYRLEQQMHFMLNNPDVGICSSWFRRFGLGKNISVNYPSDNEWLKIQFIENNYCLHPGLCIRRSLFPSEESLLYNEQYRYASDYDFVSRNFKHFRIYNIPEILMEYRVHETQITSSKFREQQHYADQVRINYLQNLDLFPDDTEREIHLALMRGSNPPVFNMNDYLNWSSKILDYNSLHPFFDNKLLIMFLKEKLKALKTKFEQNHG